MWNQDKHQEIIADVKVVAGRLRELGGSTFGISVGDKGSKKTEAELDAQAALLKDILKICEANRIIANLHNHTYEVENNLHDLKGTMARVPEIKLGPDLNWLIRGKIDPVWFINTYKDKIVYMHIRDQYSNGKWTESIGEGDTDFAAIAKALKEINYSGPAAIELAFDSPPKRPLADDWKMSSSFVRQTFGW